MSRMCREVCRVVLVCSRVQPQAISFVGDTVVCLFAPRASGEERLRTLARELATCRVVAVYVDCTRVMLGWVVGGHRVVTNAFGVHWEMIWGLFICDGEG
jgi:hypothetical protein